MPHGVEALDDGWSRIGRGKGRKPQPTEGLNPPLKDLTLDQLRADFATKSKAWRQSSCRRETLAILDRQAPEGGWAITEAICFATGSFSRDNWNSRQRSVTQFAAFMDIVQYLQSHQKDHITILAQDPMFTELDMTFLAGQDVRVLDAEQGKESAVAYRSIGEAGNCVTSSSFIFEPFLDMNSHTALTLLSPEPRLYIGSCFERAEEYSKKTDEQIRAAERHLVSTDRSEINSIEPQYDGIADKLKAVLAGRKRYRLPVFAEEPNIFEGMSVSWMEVDDGGGS